MSKLLGQCSVLLSIDVTPPLKHSVQLLGDLLGIMKDTLTGTNFPMSKEGRTYHVGTKAGEVANRIVSFGISFECFAWFFSCFELVVDTS